MLTDDDDVQTDGQRIPAYTISLPMSLRLKRAKNGSAFIQFLLYKHSCAFLSLVLFHFILACEYQLVVWTI